MSTEQIYKDFGKELLTFIRSRVNNDNDAEDIFQDIFIRIHQKINTLKDETKLQSWLYQISRNAIIDSYRKKKPVMTSDKGLENIAMEIETTRHDFSNCIRPFIKELPEKYGDVLNQTIYEGVSLKQYAENFDLSYTATKTRVQRARKKLKEIFHCCCVDHAQQDQFDINGTDSNCHC